MIRRHLAPELAVLVIICTLGVFFFPALTGPYSTVHGPVTALRAMRALLLLLIAFLLAFVNLSQFAAARLDAVRAANDPPDLHAFELSSVLRC